MKTLPYLFLMLFALGCTEEKTTSIRLDQIKDGAITQPKTGVDSIITHLRKQVKTLNDKLEACEKKETNK